MNFFFPPFSDQFSKSFYKSHGVKVLWFDDVKLGSSGIKIKFSAAVLSIYQIEWPTLAIQKSTSKTHYHHRLINFDRCIANKTFELSAFCSLHWITFYVPIRRKLAGGCIFTCFTYKPTRASACISILERKMRKVSKQTWMMTSAYCIL